MAMRPDGLHVGQEPFGVAQGEPAPAMVGEKAARQSGSDRVCPHEPCGLLHHPLVTGAVRSPVTARQRNAALSAE